MIEFYTMTFNKSDGRDLTMKKSALSLTTIALLAVTFSASASKPAKITPGESGKTADGVEYRNYNVTCSDGKIQPLTSWDDGKKWCIGHASQENCEKKQIKAAKQACKL